MGYVELDLQISADVKAITKQVQRFSQRELRPAGIELDRLHAPGDVFARDSVFWEVFRTYRNLGLHTIDIPKQIGGMAGELDPKAGPIIAEEMGTGDPGLALGLAISDLPFSLAALSSETELQNLAKRYCEDTDARMVGCGVLPESGPYMDWLLSKNPESLDYTPDVLALADGNEYILSGETSQWISNVPIATHAAVFVGRESEQGNRGYGIALVPLDLPGITISGPLDRIGQRTLPKSRVAFGDVKLPGTWLAMRSMEKVRALLRKTIARTNSITAAISVGLAQAAYDEALQYAKQRVQGGVPIFEHKNIRLQLFNMFLKTETARAYVRRVAAYHAATQVESLHHAIASKVLSTKTAFEVASEAIAIFGGNGLSREYPIEKMFRDARVAMVSHGENDALSISSAAELTA